MVKQFFEPKRLFFICGLILLVVYTGWLAKEASSKTVNATVDLKHPDFFAKNLNAIEFDATGNKLHVLITPYLQHFPLKDSSHLKTPKFIIYSNKDNKSPWYVTSDNGETMDGTDIIYLLGHVVIHQPESGNNNDITIRTDRLTIYSKENFAETDAPVTIEEPGIVVNSIGMKVYFKEKRVILLNQARGVYEQQKDSRVKH